MANVLQTILAFVFFWSLPAVSAGQYQCRSLFSDSLNSIEKLRQAINEKGLTLALDWRQSEVGLSDSDLWYVTGAHSILADGLKKKRKVPGVVFHLGSRKIRNKVYGDYNPTMESLKLAKQFENKINEARYILATDPASYPKTIFVSDLDWRPIKSEEITKALVLARLKEFFALMDDRFPEGFIIKHAFEFKSGDSKTGPVITGKATPVNLASHFFSLLPNVKNHEFWGSRNFEKKFFTEDWDPYFAVTYALLLAPEHLMVQEKLKIAEEFREDYIAGEVVHAQPRYGRAYVSDNAEGAKKFLDQVLQNENGKLQVAAGGADVAFVAAENKFEIIELNLGGESAYVDPLYLPVSANVFLSTILGYDTPLIRDLKQVKLQSKEARFEFIKNFAQKYLKYLWANARRDAISEFEDYLGLGVK